MHTEYISVSRNTLEKLIVHGGKAVAVGTTSVRTLESLYHIGVTLLNNPEATEEDLHVHQWQPYEMSAKATATSAVEALQAIVAYLDRHSMEALHTSTQIIIAPGYEYKIVKAMVTNFHQRKVPCCCSYQLSYTVIGRRFTTMHWHMISAS